MSIERDYDFFNLYCDICGEEAEEQFFEFQEAVDYKKSNGWKSKRKGGEWQDVCPDCVDELGLS